MIDLDRVEQGYRKDMDQVSQWEQSKYDEYFSEHFKGLDHLREQLSMCIITDNELEFVLIHLPLELLSVSAKLSELKTAQEVIRIGIKKKEEQAVDELRKSMTLTEAKKLAADKVTDDKLLVSVYDSLYERVSRQVTFSKELIMSAKKIWDARRNSEQPMPSIPAEDPEALPEYQTPKAPSTYIK